MPDFLTIDALSKNYANGFEALKTINLRVEEALDVILLNRSRITERFGFPNLFEPDVI